MKPISNCSAAHVVQADEQRLNLGVCHLYRDTKLTGITPRHLDMLSGVPTAKDGSPKGTIVKNQLKQVRAAGARGQSPICERM